MCGIFGMAGDPRAARSVPLERALRALRHRGPDGEGTFRGESVDGRTGCAFVHTRLAILDVSNAAAQPMTTADRRYTLVFNGEVYNYAELRSELEALGTRVSSSGDTEVILRAYEQWGDAAFARLRGMFALAIWDALEGRLVLCRDRLGIKPLYYRESAEGLAFSSEIRALLTTGLAPARISREGLRSYLSTGAVEEPHSILEGVLVSPPGEFLAFRERRLVRKAYWDLPEARSGDVAFRDAVDELRPVLHEAVRLHLVSDVPLGVFLSGGVDSSTVVGLAALASSCPVHTFTVAFDEKDYTEERHAAAVAARFGCDHHQVRLSETRAAAELPGVWETADRPSADGLNTYFVAEAAREAGLRVALSGLGGDELFAGYEGFRRFGRYLRLGRMAGRVLPGRLAHRGERLMDGFHGSNKLRKASALLAAGGDVVRTYSAMRGMFLEPQVDRLTRTWSGGRSGSKRDSASHANSCTDPVNVFSRLELRNYLRNTLLRDTDAMSMAHSLEVRVPLLDHRLVDLVLPLPGSLKLDRAVNKPLLVAAAPDLPPDVAQRPKMGFVLPFERWFRGPMRAFLAELFLSRDAPAGILDPRALTAVWREFERGPEYVSYSRISCLASLLLWARAHRVELAE